VVGISTEEIFGILQMLCLNHIINCKKQNYLWPYLFTIYFFIEN